MKLQPKHFILAVAFAVVLIAPYVALADSNAINSNVWSPTILKGPLVVCAGNGGGGLPTCSNFCDLVGQVANVVYFFIGVTIWLIAPIMLAWSGISLMLSQGSAEGRSAAKHRITRIVIGIMISLSAYLIIYTFVSVLNISGIGGFGTNSCVVQ